MYDLMIACEPILSVSALPNLMKATQCHFKTQTKKYKYIYKPIQISTESSGRSGRSIHCVLRILQFVQDHITP